MMASALVFMFFVPVAEALQISPINPQLLGKERATILWLSQPDTEKKASNTASESKFSYQVRVYKWSQLNGTDVYADQNEVLASPPVFQFMGDNRQGIRLSRILPAAPVGENAYRIIIDRIPDANQTASKGLKLQLRYVLSFFDYGSTLDPDYIPDFTGAVNKVSPAHWKIIPNTAGKNCGNEMKSNPYAYCLEITNKGPVHLRLSNIRFTKQSVSNPVYQSSLGLMGYVLPGQTMRFGLAKWNSAATTGLKLFTEVKGDEYRIISNE